MDPAQELQASRNKVDDYPCNLIQTGQFQFDLEQYKTAFCDEKGGYFNPKHQKISLWSLNDTKHGFQSNDQVSDQGLLDQLSDTTSDPISTFIFLYSMTSRSALRCSRQQMGHILTHHQVMAAFLDLVFTFREREEPETLTVFRAEDHISESNAAFAHPNLNRSGLRIQHCFNLIAVEFNDKDDKSWPWFLRQTATYHSFDIIKGNALWISLKGNEQISKRLKKSIPAHSQLRPSALESTESRFTATLLTHLIIFQWCVENWPKFINFLEGQLNCQLEKVRLAPVTRMTEPEKIEKFAALRRGTTFNSAIGHVPPSRGGTLRKTHSFQPPKLVKRISSQISAKLLPEKKPQTPPKPETKGLDLDFNQLYNFEELQKLGQLKDEMQLHHLVMGQNINIMQEIVVRYTTLFALEDFCRHIDIKKCRGGLDIFLSRTRQLIRDMENNAMRLKNLIAVLESTEDQFHGILQYRNIRTGEYFAQSAHDSAKVMEQMAVKTKQETVSMHSITILTLVFLPGTFLAMTLFAWLILTRPSLLQTVFGSGLLRWEEQGGDWTARVPGLRLFLAICLPMTTFTLGVWLFWNWISKKRQKDDFLRLRMAEEGLSEGGRLKGEAVEK